MLLAALFRLAKLKTRSKPQPHVDDSKPIYPDHIDISFFYQPPAEPAEPDPNTTQDE